ncbi:MAG: prepilin-type N-terminal cleavage/methylation domain-containing protein [Planctomycetota bacterium]|nr:prepilin-type N-terminal cleavage/methylation domain-containing protein [Planctomycetota bacterium]
MKSPMNKRGARQGFTLLEVILSASLLAAGMSMILGVFNFGAAVVRNAELRSLSATAVEALINDLEENLFELQPDGSVGEPSLIVDRPVPGRPGVRYTVQATPNTAALDAQGRAREYVVEVVVNWSSSGVERAARWTTIMLREVPFGARMRRRFVR